MTDRISPETLIEYLLHGRSMAHEDLTRQADPARKEPLSLADAIAADLAFDAATAAAIEREAGKSNR